MPQVLERVPPRLRSRKFWVFVVASTLVTIASGADVNLDPAQLATLIDSIVKLAAAYLVGQGVADHGGKQLLEIGKQIADLVGQVRSQLPPPSQVDTEGGQ